MSQTTLTDDVLTKFSKEIEMKLNDNENDDEYTIESLSVLDDKNAKIYIPYIDDYKANNSCLVYVICNKIMDNDDDDDIKKDTKQKCGKLIILNKKVTNNEEINDVNRKRKLSINDENNGPPIKKIKLNDDSIKAVNHGNNDINVDDYDVININCECLITYDIMNIMDCIQYSFDGKNWYIGKISFDAFNGYKKSKFKLWKDLLIKTTCKATLKRLLNMGIINKMFDRHLFMPKKDENDWKIIDDKGNTIYIPRMIKYARKWNANENKYDDVNCLLDDAPNDDNKEKYWNDMIKEFRETRGQEFIDQLLDKK